MAQASQSRQKEVDSDSPVKHRLREGALLLLMAVAAYLLLSLVTYSSQDPGWSFTGHRGEPQNAGGPAGAWFADVLLYLFGILGYLFPIMVGWSGWLILKERNPDNSTNFVLVALRWAGFFLTIISGSVLATLHLQHFAGYLPAGAGGVLGQSLHDLLVGSFSQAGSTLLSLAIFLAAFTLFTGISWLSVVDWIGGLVLDAFRYVGNYRQRSADKRRAKALKRQRSDVVKEEKKKKETRKPVRIEPVIKEVKVSERVEKERQVPLFETEPEGLLPPLALLDEAKHSGKELSKEALTALSQLVELKLKDFGVQVEVVAVHLGQSSPCLSCSWLQVPKPARLRGSQRTWLERSLPPVFEWLK